MSSEKPSKVNALSGVDSGGGDAPTAGGPAEDPILGQLKAAYDEVAEEPFPQYLLDLLEKLEEAEKRG